MKMHPITASNRLWHQKRNNQLTLPLPRATTHITITSVREYTCQTTPRQRAYTIILHSMCVTQKLTNTYLMQNMMQGMVTNYTDEVRLICYKLSVTLSYTRFIKRMRGLGFLSTAIFEFSWQFVNSL